MPSGPGRKRLIVIQKQNERDAFRFVSQSPNKKINPSRIKWAGCEKPKLPTMFTIESPGTTFARFAPTTPNFSGSGEIFSFPCPPKPWEITGPRPTGRPKPLETKNALLKKIREVNNQKLAFIK